MRWYVERRRSNYPKRGFGLWYERGSTGTTYGEPGRNQFLSITFLFLAWEVFGHFSWKSNLDETNT